MAGRRVLVERGDSFGRLTVEAELPSRRRPSGGTRRYFECRCECGTLVEVSLHHLRSGHTISCGCLLRDKQRERSDYHGMEGSLAWQTWESMKHRCYKKSSRGYSNYGGRGIRVCERWRHSFKAFLEDMGPRPSADHSIDRIDNDGDYEPGNCRWALRSEQSRNRSDNRILEYRGERMCMTDWARRFGIRKSTLHSRLERGMSVEEALTTPVRQWIPSTG